MPPPTQRLNPQWPFLLGGPQSVTVYTDVVSGTIILGGSLAEFPTSPPVAFSPAQVKLNPNPQWPFWIPAPATPVVIPSVVYSDVVTGAVIFGGSLAEFATSPPFSPPVLLTPNPQWPFKVAAAPVPPGAPVYMDTTTGALIFGGSVAEGTVYSDAVTGTIIFGGTVYEFATSPPPAFSPAQVKLNPNPQWPFWIPAPASAPVVATAVVYSDVVTGAIIFGGSLVEGKVYTDARTGAIIFGGSTVESEKIGAHILYIQNQLFRKMP